MSNAVDVRLLDSLLLRAYQVSGTNIARFFFFRFFIATPTPPDRSPIFFELIKHMGTLCSSVVEEFARACSYSWSAADRPFFRVLRRRSFFSLLVPLRDSPFFYDQALRAYRIRHH